MKTIYSKKNLHHFYFPYNLLKDIVNFQSADRRIERLEELRKEKGCVVSNAEIEEKKE